jgi:hypothetical protein
VLGIEYFFGYSPQAANWIDPHELAKHALAFVGGIHGQENILSAHLHMDERTPHVHVVAAPVSGGRLKVEPFMGSRAKLRKLQDDFFEQVSSRFGLARTGDNPTGRRHLPPAELRAQTQAVARTITDVKRQLEAAVMTPPVRLISESVSAVSLLTAKGRAAFVRTVEAEATAKLSEMRRRLLSAACATLDEIQELAANAAILKEENDAMKQWQLNELRDIPLPRIAELYLGVVPRREGASWVWETHDHKIVAKGDGPQFYDFKMPTGGLGGGAIDLAMHLLGCDFRTAIRVMASDFPAVLSGAVRSHHMRRAHEETAAALAAPKRLTFEELRARYADPVSSNLSLVRRYLNDARMIPLPLVDRIIDTGDLWANKWGSCVFAHRDLSGEIHGCSIRATVGDFKQTIGVKRNAWFSIGMPPAKAARLVLAESPIDALSFEVLGQNAVDDAIISMAGQSEPSALVALGRPMLMAQDADDVGEQQASAIASIVILGGQKAERKRPVRGKDWNEQLTYDRDKRQRTDREIAERAAEVARALESSLGGSREARSRGPDTGLSGSGPSAHQAGGDPIHRAHR